MKKKKKTFEIRLSKRLCFGFSLIELMVVVAIMGVISAGSIVLMGNYNSKQRIISAKDGLTSSLSLARNYAITMQNTGATPLKYVKFDVTHAGVVTVSSDTGGVYFTRDISQDDVTINSVINPILFESYSGKLVNDIGGVLVPYVAGVEGNYSIVSNEDVGSSVSVTVSSTGKISYNYSVSGDVVSSPGEVAIITPIPTVNNGPRATATTVPTNTFTCSRWSLLVPEVFNLVKPVQAVAGQCDPRCQPISEIYPSQVACTIGCHNDSLCSSCGLATCGNTVEFEPTDVPVVLPTSTPRPPTPTPIPPTPTVTPTPFCRADGSECQGNFDCCSGDCNSYVCGASGPPSDYCAPPQTNPHFSETSPNNCSQIDSCGYNDQYCL